MINQKAVRSCQVSVGEIKGKEVLTIEGLAEDGRLHPLQKSFIAHDAFQCGFCTSGMILTAYGLLQNQPRPSREDIISGMDRNLCRCGAHTRIVDAVQTAAAEMAGSHK